MAHPLVNLSHSPDRRGLSKYQLVAVIGRGGMADVFVALRRGDGVLDGKVVIKQLRADVADDEDFRTMFLDEARLARCFAHPNVVRTLEAGREGSRCYIVMEFLDGQPLSRIQSRAGDKGRLPLAVQLYVFGAALGGLDYVHDLADERGKPLGIVHRDVTPHNVFICYDGQVKLLDFGIAKAAARNAETKIGVVKGKLPYMAPEHLRGGAVDRRSDIFSVGVMLWEAIAGRRYWDGHEELTIYRRLLAGDLPEVRSRAPVHPRLGSILERALAVDVERRYGTAREMRDDVVAALGEIAPGVGTADVAACAAELFARERMAFDALLRRAQRVPRPGEVSAANLDLLGEPVPPFSDDGETRVWQGDANSRRRTTMRGAATARSIDDQIDFRGGSPRLRALAWLLVAGGVGFTAASSLMKPSTTLSASPVKTVVIREQPAASVALTGASATADEPPPPASTLPKPVAAPTPARVPHAFVPPYHAPLVQKPVLSTVDEFLKAKPTHRTLDRDDPWSE